MCCMILPLSTSLLRVLLSFSNPMLFLVSEQGIHRSRCQLDFHQLGNLLSLWPFGAEATHLTKPCLLIRWTLLVVAVGE